MRCRESLLALINESNDRSDLAIGEDQLKAADFPAWNERIANAVTQGLAGSAPS